MNILISVDAIFEEKTGGHRRYIADFTRRLVRQGHGVTILVPAFFPNEAMERNLEGVRVVKYPAVPSPREMLTTSARSCANVLDKLDEETGFDVINIHFAYSGIGILRSRCAARIANVYSFYGPWADEVYIERKAGSSLIRALISRLVMARIERRVVRRCDCCLVLSEFSRKQLMQVHGVASEHIRVINGAVDTDRFTPGDRNAARAALNLPGERPILVAVRRLIRRMGLDLLVDAMARVRQIHPLVLLLIGGTGPLAEELNARINALGLQENVRLLGFIPEEQLPELYRAADGCVMPTRALEGFGLATAEAMACGIPVLATPVDANVELVSGIDPALLFEAADPDAMARGIERFLAEECRRDLREQCARYVREKFSWEVVLPRIVAAYKTAGGRFV